MVYTESIYGFESFDARAASRVWREQNARRYLASKREARKARRLNESRLFGLAAVVCASLAVLTLVLDYA